MSSVANDIPENWFEDTKATKIGHPKLPVGKERKDIGNFVLLDHQNCEYSLLVHMKPGNEIVRPAWRYVFAHYVLRHGDRRK